MSVTKPPNRRPNHTCDLCAAPIYRRKSQIQRQAGKYCSRACRNKVHRAQCYGPNPKKALPLEKNPAWKGGVTYKRSKGNYIGPKYVRCPKEFQEMSRKDGYVMEHRLIMAMHLNRSLQRVEVVHHKDHNTRNNSIHNLELFPNNRAHKIAEGAEKRSAILASAPL